MMSRRAQENLVAGFILLVFVAAIVASAGYGPRARMVPIPIAALGAILVVVQMVRQNLRADEDLRIDMLEFLTKRPVATDAARASSQANLTEAANKPAPTLRDGLYAFGIVAALVTLFLLIGPIPSMFLFTAAYFILSRHYAPAKGLAYALFYTVLTYAVFAWGLRVQLDRSVLDLSFGIL